MSFQIPLPDYEFEERGAGSHGYGDTYTSRMLAFKDAAEAEAYSTAESNPEWNEIQRYVDFIEGRQWAGDRPKYRSNYRDNRVGLARVDYISQLTDIRPTIDVRPNNESFRDQSDILQKVIHSEWRRCELDMELGRVIDHSLFGFAFWRIGAVMPGKMVISSCGMDTVFPVQQVGPSIQTSSLVLYKTYKPLSYFRMKFGERADGIEDEIDTIGYLGNASNTYTRPGYLPEYSWDSLSPAMQYHLGKKAMRPTARVGMELFPVVQLQEYWVDDYSTNPFEKAVLVKDPNLSIKDHNYWYMVNPGERLFPRKRLIVFAGNRLMYDGPSPYWHGMFPFERLCLNPITWGPGGLSTYRDKIPLQRAMNEIGAGTLDLVRRCLNPQMISKMGSVSDTAWNKFQADKPGGKLLLNAMSEPGNAIRYVEPPALPSYVTQFAQYVMSSFREHAGSMDMPAIKSKKQSPSGDTIEKMQDMLSTPLRLQSRYVESFLRAVGVHAVSNIFQFFTAKQRMTILGKDGITLEDFDYDPNRMMVPAMTPKESHHKSFRFEIAEGSLHGASRERSKQQALVLFKMGAISLQELYRQLEIGNGASIIQEIAQEAKLKQEIAPQKPAGRQPRTQSAQKKGGV